MVVNIVENWATKDAEQTFTNGLLKTAFLLDFKYCALTAIAVALLIAESVRMLQKGNLYLCRTALNKAVPETPS